MTPRPRTVKVGPTKWKIRYLTKLDSDEVVGLTLAAKHEVQIYSKMPEPSIRATLLHELLHVIAWTYGFHMPKGDTEEAVVSLFSVPLLTLLQDNARVTEYLLEK
jgi:hypothetical protein